MKKRNVVIAGGGTGGHIYPGIALAEKLKLTHPHIQVHFVGAVGGLEESIVPRHGYPLHLLKVGRLHKSVGLFQRLKTLLTLPVSFLQSFLLYLKLKPLWVLGVGGFASGPFVFVSSLLGAKTALLEPNAMPGLANRLLARLVNKCFLVFKEAKVYFPEKKVKVVGLPVRLGKQKPNVTYDGSSPFKILIFGGSQGARAVNNAIGEWIESLGPSSKDYKIFHQIGSRDFHIWQKRYGNKYQTFLEYAEYIHNMPEKLNWADFIICRAGIGTVAEIAMSSKPALFIPLPTAADNHQVKNAESLVKMGAALMIEERDMNLTALHQMITDVKNHPAKLKTMTQPLAAMDYSSAPEQILSTLMDQK